MNKTLTAIAAVLVGSMGHDLPAQALTYNQALDDIHDGLNEIGRLVDAEEYASACKVGKTIIQRFKEARSSAGANISFLDKWEPRTRNNVDFWCEQAGKPVSASSVSSIIRRQCSQKWGTKYTMVKWCIDQETKAARSLGL